MKTIKLFPFLLYSSLTILGSCESGPSQLEMDEEREWQEKQDSLKAEKEKLEQARIDNVLYFETVSDSLKNKNKTSQAIDYLDSAISLSVYKEEGNLFQKKANYCFEIRDYETALEYYDRLIGKKLILDTNYYQRALCHKKNGDIKAAVEDLYFSKKEGHEAAAELYEKLNPEKKRIIRYVTRCCDGSTSNSSGSGACSHHGGVCNWNEPVYEIYRKFEFKEE